MTDILIEKLAAKLGTTTEYLWGVLIYQSKVYLVGTGIQYIICFAVMWFGIKRIRKILKSEHISERQALIVFVVGVAVLIASLSAFFEIETYTTALLNPEGYALKQILKGLK